LDDELVEEARKNRDLRKNTGDSVSADETADAKARRKALRAEIDILVNQILQAALDNMKETKASRVSGLPGYKSKQSIFDEVIREDEKIRDKKIEIENQNALFRNNAALLASKEFDLSLLELEK
jgi:LAS superfamily LD-carboxypeptidase LdcB